jgi:transcriptional regulator with XRE-family HTH domain
MAIANLIVVAVKRLLRARQLTYRHVAAALDLSEPSVKRLFSSKRFSLAQIEKLAELLGMTTSELLAESEAGTPRLNVLTRDQEERLIADERRLLVAVCVVNQWTIDDIVVTYSLTTAECIKHVLALEKMGLLHLYPGNRIRLLLARDFDWLSNGPIREFLRTNTFPDFLAANFDEDENEYLYFGHGMLTAEGRRQLRIEMERVRKKLSSFHEACASASLSEKRGTAVLIATRSWEPLPFERLRRQQHE